MLWLQRLQMIARSSQPFEATVIKKQTSMLFQKILSQTRGSAFSKNSPLILFSNLLVWLSHNGSKRPG